MTSLSAARVYNGRSGTASWEGCQVTDVTRFQAYLKGHVQPRIADTGTGFASELQGLATTGMASTFVARLLHAVPPPEDWEVGEALAECVLANEWGRIVVWPWNSVRDRRTPRASLPGADLVGFVKDGAGKAQLLFGEVKTSSDANSPPNVMYGGSGMTWQLKAAATELDIRRSLLQWLHSRCTTSAAKELYTEAVSRFVATNGRGLLVVGVLMRDTSPNELDLKSRAKALAKDLPAPTEVALIAWYLPIAITTWPSHLGGGAP